MALVDDLGLEQVVVIGSSLGTAAAVLAGPWARRAWVSYYRSKLYPGPTPPDLDAYVAQLDAMLAQPPVAGAVDALARRAFGVGDG